MPPSEQGAEGRARRLNGSAITAAVLAGEPIIAKLSEAPNGAAIGGVKVVTEHLCWFAARRYTEDVYSLRRSRLWGRTAARKLWCR
jgi:phosphoglucomutase